MYSLVPTQWHQYRVAGCCGHQDRLGLGWTLSSSSLGWWLESSMVGCERCSECLLVLLSSSTLGWWCWPPLSSTLRVVVEIGVMPTAAIAVVNAGVAMVIVFVLAAEGGGDWYCQWSCEQRGERALTCSCIDDRHPALSSLGVWWSMWLRQRWTEENFDVVICHHNTPEFFKVPHVSPTLTDHTPIIAIAVDQRQVSTLWSRPQHTTDDDRGTPSVDNRLK